MILCDTDILVDIWRNYSPALAWASGLGRDELVIPGFVAMELVQGCETNASLSAAENVLQSFRLVWPTGEASNRALQSLQRFHNSHGLGLVDALIAHTALALATPVHTFNRKHFTVIEGLQVIEPYERTRP